MILDPIPDREEWLAWRAEGVTATAVVAYAGLYPPHFDSSPFQVWARIRGEIEDKDPTDAMFAGLDAEPLISKWFQRFSGLYVIDEQARAVCDAEPLFRATLDGLVVESPSSTRADAVAVYEAKSVLSTFDVWRSPPVYYVAQTQWQMMCAGLDRAIIAALFAGPNFRSWEIDRDETVIASLVERARDLVERLRSGEPPPADASRAYQEYAIRHWPDDPHAAPILNAADGEILSVLADLLDARKMQRFADRRVDECRNAIAAWCLAHQCSGAELNGDEIFRARPRKGRRFSSDQFRRDHPALFDEYQVETRSWIDVRVTEGALP